MGGYWINVHVSAYQSKGEPDVVGVHQGKFYGFELKTKKFKTSTTQKEKLNRINLAGGVAMEIRSIDELKELFNIQ